VNPLRRSGVAGRFASISAGLRAGGSIMTALAPTDGLEQVVHEYSS